jgi:hypothetical protein
MTEEFLHYLWKHKILPSELRTDKGENINILGSGIHNHDSGPDFLDARIEIDNTLWAGNVEIHVNSSDWHRHGHQKDKAYDNIILHFVYQNDREVFRTNGETIPTLVLGNNYDKKLFNLYLDFKTSEARIPCINQINGIDNFVIETYKERLGIERIELKTRNIDKILKRTKMNWEHCFYEMLFINFGFQKNNSGFELLSGSLPLKVIYESGNSILTMEALLFGQAGFLTGKTFREKYPLQLQKEYQHLQAKYRLKHIENHLWKFLRLRPSNFPTIRISQLAAVLCKKQRIFSEIIIPGNFKGITELFNVKASDFWNTHYTFNKKSVYNEKKLGMDSIYLIMINTIIPLLFHYGKFKRNAQYVDTALEYLRNIPPETNAVIKKWRKAETGINNAFDTQSLIHLCKEYCNYKKWLHCTIGHNLLRKNKT